MPDTGLEFAMRAGATAARIDARPSEQSERLEWHAFFLPGTPVMALPGWERPRILVPATTASGRWHGSGFYPAFRLTARCFRWLLRLKALSGSGAVRVSRQPTAGPTLQEYLADTLPNARAQAVLLRMADRSRKLTIRLVGADGTVAGYLKCAASRLASERLRNEYDLLRELPSGAGPRPLKYARIAAMDALLTEPVRGRPLAATLPPPEQLLRFTASLSAPRRYALQAHPWVRGRYPPAEPEYQAILSDLSARDWGVVRQHGDLAPWNVLQNRAGNLTAIDWEYGCREGFPGMDLAQYVLQLAGLILRWEPVRAREYATRYLLDSGLDSSVREATAIVRLAAFVAFQNTMLDGGTADDPLQIWRRSIWAARQ